MAHRSIRTVTAIAVITLMLGVWLGVACDSDDDGPVDNAQETIEEGLEDVGDTIEEGAEDVQEGAEDIVEEGAEEIEEGADDVDDALEDETPTPSPTS